MSDLSPETRKLLDMARDGDRLPPGRRALLESKFFTRVAGGALIGLVAREAWAVKSAGLFGPIAKGIAGLALVSSLGAGGYFAFRASRHDVSTRDVPATQRPTDVARPAIPPTPWTEPATQAMNAAPVRAPRASDTPDTPRRPTSAEVREARRSSSSVSTAPARASNAARTSSATSRTSAAAAATAPLAAPDPTPAPAEEAPPVRLPDTLADETRLLAEADQALRSGKTSRAVALLDEHASRYPEGALSLERGGERVVALCKLGRVDAPTVRSYLSSHPNLPLTDRVQQACASILSRAK